MFFLNKGNASAHKTLYINARIIDPETMLDVYGNLLTVDEKIHSFSPSLKIDKSLVDEVIDCENNILMPGIIDIHVHLRDPGFTHKETIESGTMAAASGGVTTVVCQPNTNPKIENQIVLAYIQNKAREVAYVNVKTYAGITNSNTGSLTDMYLLYKAGAIGFTDDGLPVANAFLMREALSYSCITGLHIAQHAEDLHLSNCGCMAEGIISNKLNVPGIPETAESTIVSRDLLLVEELKAARYHLMHVSTKRSMELIIDAKSKSLDVTCEVTPHHLLLNENSLEGYNTLAKVNPPLQTEENRLFLVESLKNGYIDVIASDHAPHEKDAKNLSLLDAPFGISGVETILPLSLKFYHDSTLSLHDLLAKLTCNPAKIIKSEAGRIKKGAPADLIILDLNKEWFIETSKFYSKSNNSPFDGTAVKGKVLRTIVGGKTVFKLN